MGAYRNEPYRRVLETDMSVTSTRVVASFISRESMEEINRAITREDATACHARRSIKGSKVVLEMEVFERISANSGKPRASRRPRPLRSQAAVIV